MILCLGGAGDCGGGGNIAVTILFLLAGGHRVTDQTSSTVRTIAANLNFVLSSTIIWYMLPRQRVICEAHSKIVLR